MSDIVERLRAPLGVMQCEVSSGPAPENRLERRWLVALEAAAEIERLRAALEWIVCCALTEPQAMADKARAALGDRKEVDWGMPAGKEEW